MAIAEARLAAASDRLEREKAAKRGQIAEMRERIRRFEAGEGPKPNPGPFSFDENRGREVALAHRWVARAGRELAAARQRAAAAADRAGEAAGLPAVPGGGQARAARRREGRRKSGTAPPRQYQPTGGAALAMGGHVRRPQDKREPPIWAASLLSLEPVQAMQIGTFCVAGMIRSRGCRRG